MSGLRVRAVGPVVTYTDEGRPRRMRWGVPASAPMDPEALAAIRAVAGPGAAVEVSLGGLEVAVEGAPCTLAVAGGGFDVVRNGLNVSAPCAFAAFPGDVVRIAPRTRGGGAWAYLAASGGFDAATWQGSAATHVASGLGGGALAQGDLIPFAAPRIDYARQGAIALPGRAGGPFRLILGPQDRHFPAKVIDRLFASEWRATARGNRMGMGIDGPALRPEGALSIPSEPLVRGAVQVNGEGGAVVLAADHQTAAGYPKIAVLASVDHGRFAQLRPGAAFRFERITPAEAVALKRAADGGGAPDGPAGA
ncbi:MAG: 5-oxoprolinase subunit C family protein [Hasllibacter sp.]